MPLTVLTWNVQNFGQTKGGLLYKNFDITFAIAKIVSLHKPDIFVLIELNTTKDNIATRLCDNIVYCLRKATGDNWIAVISPNTGKEFYAYFIKNVNNTKPYLCNLRMISGAPGVSLSNATFTSLNTYNTVNPGAVLLGPDNEITVKGKKIKLLWPAARHPAALALDVPKFETATNQTGNDLVVLVASHFSPRVSVAKKQFKQLGVFSFFGTFGKHTQQVQLACDGQNLPLRNVILVADFNVKYTASNYRIFSTIADGANGTSVANKNYDTLLATPKYVKQNRLKTPSSLARENIDNLIYFGYRPTGLMPGIPAVPRYVQKRTVKLSESVQYYQQLDKRGFSSNGYLGISDDFALQLTGDPSHIVNINGTIVGSRLLSDHLPVEVKIT